MTEKRDAVLFVNIPFCIKVPRYTHGAYVQGDSAAKREYLEAVERELASLGDVLEGKRLVAVRLGGGGPSVMNPDQLGGLMRTIRTTLPLVPGAALELEALPNTVGVPSLTGWGQGKPSHIELLVGAIHLRDLATLERPFRVADIQNAVLFLDKFGMNSVCVSLTYGMPGQTTQSWKQTLRKACDLEPVEVRITPVTPADGVGMGKEQQWALYETACDLLNQNGFVERAPGRFARGKGFSAYTQALGAGADELAVGLGAVSCADGLVWRTTDDFATYCAASDQPDRVLAEVCQLDDQAQSVLYARRVLGGAEGLCEEAYQARFGAPLPPPLVSMLAQWTNEGLVEERDGRTVLTPRGRFEWQWRNEPQ